MDGSKCGSRQPVALTLLALLATTVVAHETVLDKTKMDDVSLELDIWSKIRNRLETTMITHNEKGIFVGCLITLAIIIVILKIRSYFILKQLRNVTMNEITELRTDLRLTQSELRQELLDLQNFENKVVLDNTIVPNTDDYELIEETNNSTESPDSIVVIDKADKVENANFSLPLQDILFHHLKIEDKSVPVNVIIETIKEPKKPNFSSPLHRSQFL